MMTRLILCGQMNLIYCLLSTEIKLSVLGLCLFREVLPTIDIGSRVDSIIIYLFYIKLLYIHMNYIFQKTNKMYISS